jgi:uncharacterized protein (UPF0303 family)
MGESVSRPMRFATGTFRIQTQSFIWAVVCVSGGSHVSDHNVMAAHRIVGRHVSTWRRNFLSPPYSLMM